MPRKVFVSHQKQDSAEATKVSNRVRQNGIETYLDIIDDALMRDGPSLADHIRSRMSECDQLIAVVSTNTKTSWWVPWEIGVATEKDFRIASYAESYVSLPSYLEKWPTLQTMHDVDLYCTYSKDNESNLKKNLHEATIASRREAITKREINNFHQSLMSALKARR